MNGCRCELNSRRLVLHACRIELHTRRSHLSRVELALHRRRSTVFPHPFHVNRPERVLHTRRPELDRRRSRLHTGRFRLNTRPFELHNRPSLLYKWVGDWEPVELASLGIDLKEWGSHIERLGMTLLLNPVEWTLDERNETRDPI
jgi:hypothetical protein